MLRITKQTDYGILLMSLFTRDGGMGVHSARDLAESAGLPLPMVGKILKLLVKEGLLQSQRGVKGGYQLARPANEINVAQIVTALDGPISITECASEAESDCRYGDACPLQPNWMKINQAVQRALQGISLAEMTLAEGCHTGVL
jgi:FeS assembly SUF system regulator